MTNTKKMKISQEKPSWFNGSWYDNPETVENPFTGESCELTGPECSMYDFIMGATYTIEQNYQHEVMDNIVTRLSKEKDKAMDWFREANPKAFMKLLD
jgi:hypothetical protein